VKRKYDSGKNAGKKCENALGRKPNNGKWAKLKFNLKTLPVVVVEFL
jgi:hypothetical protein